MKNLAYLHTPIGLIELTEKDKKLIALTFVKFQKTKESSSLVLQEAKWQLEAYFEGKRKTFNLPLEFTCSALHKKIYLALKKSSFGSTLTYAELGNQVSDKNISRAVGTAMAKNPFPIIIPCHRVVNSDGTLGAYSAAEGEKSKRWLLEHEKIKYA